MAQIPDHYLGPDVEPDRSDPVIVERVEAAVELAEQRYFTASEHASVVTLRETIQQLGSIIDVVVPPGRNKALALTALEDVQMRANRGIFAPEHLR